MHAYLDGAHERRTRDILADMLPGVSITLSSEVSPEIREYERWSTAIANAYVQPVMDRYLGRLDTALKARGFACPLLLITSGGGLTTLDTARRFPIRLVESGPAAPDVGRSDLELGRLPEIHTRDRSIGSPVFHFLLHKLDGGQGFQAVDELGNATDDHIRRGSHVEAPEIKDEEDVYGP